MFRAIWRAIVVLPVPWAPPIRSSSPARRPAPIVLSSGVKPSGTGWYSPTLPGRTLSLRSTSTSSAERGAMLPYRRPAASSAAGRWVRRFRSRWVVLPVRSGCIVAPVPAAQPPESGRRRGSEGPMRVERRQLGDLVPDPDDRADPGLVVARGPSTRSGRGRGRPAGRTRAGRRAGRGSISKLGADRDRAALADVDRRPAEGRLERARGGLRDGMVDRRQARPAAAEERTVVVTPGGAICVDVVPERARRSDPGPGPGRAGS